MPSFEYKINIQEQCIFIIYQAIFIKCHPHNLTLNSLTSWIKIPCIDHILLWEEAGISNAGAYNIMPIPIICQPVTLKDGYVCVNCVKLNSYICITSDCVCCFTHWMLRGQIKTLMKPLKWNNFPYAFFKAGSYGKTKLAAFTLKLLCNCVNVLHMCANPLPELAEGSLR